MHLFFELFTAAAFVACAVHAVVRHGGEGAGFFAALALLGAARETAVAVHDILYGFAPLSLMLGPAPLIAAVIWGFSIYAAVTWCESLTGHGLADAPPAADRRWPAAAYLWVALFMVALTGFYEPFLELEGMARWEPGTRATAGVPWIALVGYPTLAVPFLLLWRWSRRRFPSPRLRGTVVACNVLVLAFAHAFGLKALKDLLAW